MLQSLMGPLTETAFQLQYKEATLRSKPTRPESELALRPTNCILTQAQLSEKTPPSVQWFYAVILIFINRFVSEIWWMVGRQVCEPTQAQSCAAWRTVFWHGARPKPESWLVMGQGLWRRGRVAVGKRVYVKVPRQQREAVDLPRVYPCFTCTNNNSRCP